MTARETGAYVAHHLKLAGRVDTLFSDDALAGIAKRRLAIRWSRAAKVPRLMRRRRVGWPTSRPAKAEWRQPVKAGERQPGHVFMPEIARDGWGGAHSAGRDDRRGSGGPGSSGGGGDGFSEVPAVRPRRPRRSLVLAPAHLRWPATKEESGGPAYRRPGCRGRSRGWLADCSAEGAVSSRRRLTPSK